MEIKRIGVVGSGVMGAGVAHDFSRNGYQVTLVDVEAHALENARSEIEKSVRFHSFFSKEGGGGDPKEILSRITFTLDGDSLAEADYLIENITEKWALKEPLYLKLDSFCTDDVIFAANTSAIPITRIGGVTNRADRVIGIHFMNPVPLKDTVEVIRGEHTSEETVTATRDLLETLGKESVVVNDAPGFVSNRILMLTVNEAAWVLQDRVAAPEQVDRIFKKCFGHKLGPLETADLIGLDTVLLTLEVLFESYKDSKFRPCPLLVRMVDAGYSGR